MKFWRKTTAKKAIDYRKNKKLGEEFEDALRQKISFETLTSETNDVLKGLVIEIFQKFLLISLFFIGGRFDVKFK